MANPNRRGTWIALGVFTALLVGVVLSREKKVSVGIQHVALPTLVQEDITRVELSGAKVATLAKEDGEWKVYDPAHPDARYPTEKASVDSLLHAIADIKTPDFVTDRVDHQVEYEVDEAHGEQVKAVSPAATLDIIVGKTTTRGGFYVRRADQKAIFLTTSPIGWAVKKGVDDLRRRKLLTLALSATRAMTVTPYGGTAYTLTRADDKAPWQLTEGQPTHAAFRFDLEGAARRVQAAVDLRAIEFVAPDKSEDPLLGFESTTSKLQLKAAPDTSVELHFGRTPSPDDAKLANQLHALFKTLDVQGTPDGQLSLAELQSPVDDSKHPAHDAALAFAHDPERFAWFDAGGFALHPRDAAISLADLESLSRTASLFPVRIEGDRQVYLVSGTSAEPLTLGAASLQDTALFSFDPAHVKTFSILSGNQTLVTVTQDASNWKWVEPKHWTAKAPFDATRVSARVAEFRRWKGLRWSEGSVSDAQAGVTTPSWTVRVVLDDGKKQEVRFGKPVGKAGDLYAKGVDGQIYVAAGRLHDLVTQGASLFEKAPPPPAQRGGGMQGLDSLPPDLRRQLQALQAQGDSGQ